MKPQTALGNHRCTLLLFVTVVLGLWTARASAAAVGVVVEAESGALAGTTLASASITASAGACISVKDAVALETSPEARLVPDARYTFDIATPGNFKVYLRMWQTKDFAINYFARWDNAPYDSYKIAQDVNWVWRETGAKALNVGRHTLDLCSSTNSGTYVDLIVVAASLSAQQKSAIDSAIIVGNRHVNTSTARTFNTVNGSVMFEAEDLTLDPNLFGKSTDALASGGAAIIALVDYLATALPDKSLAGAEFNISPDRAGIFDVWIRYRATSTQNRINLAVEGANYRQTVLTATTADPSAYGWMKLPSTTDQFFAGGKYTFRLYPARTGLCIDKIVVTSYPLFNPNGMVPTLENLAFQNSLSASAFPQPPVKPPATHPRLLFQASDIPLIRLNMTKTQNAGGLAAYQALLAKTIDGVLGPAISGGMNYHRESLAIIESYALMFALENDVTYGNRAITAIKNYLRTMEFSDSVPNVSRYLGHTIYAASVVYDWCFSLLTPEDKNYLLVATESLAKRMPELGYPPAGSVTIAGISNEGMLYRDLLSLGIASYGERPDIYNYVAGRIFSEKVAFNNDWTRSHTNSQGSAYGSYRHTWELVFQWIMKRLTGQSVLSPETEFVPYHWLYMRRPDGQWFRNGDDYQAVSATIGSHFNASCRTMGFYSGNFYGNSYVKGLYGGGGATFLGDDHTGLLTPALYLLFNNPDLESKLPETTFPLSKYFGSPHGMMIARTSWVNLTPPGVDMKSDIAMAQMTIGERFVGGHQHRDAGDFQLYYKGILASASGLYDQTGSLQMSNYYYDSIASNTLLVMDPQEVASRGVNSGGQRHPTGSIRSYSEWLQPDFDRGIVLGRSFESAGLVPQYSYIKGDITKAYTRKVSQVLRSMLFLPLSDGKHPAALVVIDKVTATDPGLRKTWLLHTQQDPSLSGSTAIVKRDISGYDGRMDLTSLLPNGAQMTKIGGPGNEFSINGVHYPTGSYGSSATEYGVWRIEVSPARAVNATDYFLHVMQVSDASANATPLATTLIETDTLAGVKIYDRVAVFGKDRERMGGPVSFQIPGSEVTGLQVLVAGVAEGVWNIYRETILTGRVTATAEGGVVYFPGRSGSYRLVKANSDSTANLLPTITRQPASVQGATAGEEVRFSVVAANAAAPSYQWYKDGTPISGATNATFVFPSVRLTDAGSYTVVVANSAGGILSETGTLTVASSRLVNLSILTAVSASGDSFTLGYVVGGAGTSGTKPLVIRAAGPSLGALGVSGTLSDPKFELYAGATKTGENDNWGGLATIANAMSAVGAFAYSGPTSRDAAVALSVASGDNSVKVSGVGNVTGTVIAEIYDATPAANFTATTPRLVNVSVLKELGAGFTAGFVVGGNGTKNVLVRAIGPTLSTIFGVGGAVSDPQLTLNSGQTVVASNDNWGGGATLASAFSSVGAFALPAASRDAVVVASLNPGNYTVQVSGVAGATGLILVEIYELP